MGRLLSLNEPACCDFGRVTTSPYPEPPPHRWRDPISHFEFRLCDLYYAAVTTNLPKTRHTRPHGSVFNRPLYPRGAKRRILAPSNHADGAGDAARAAGDADGA